MPQVPLQRWTDVALKREGGAEITKGAARLYGAVLVRETEGLLKLVLTRPARVTVPGETDASARHRARPRAQAKRGPLRDRQRERTKAVLIDPPAPRAL